MVRCLNCQKETSNKKFCSRSCAASYNNKKFVKRKSNKSRELFCLWCGGELKRSSSKYCKRRCQKEYEYHIWLNKWKLGLVSGTQSYEPRPQWQIKRYIWNKYNGKCAICGWNEMNKYNGIIHLEIDHIDGDSGNNKEDNLILLCPNCHSLTPTYKALNRGNGKKMLRCKKRIDNGQ